MTKSTTGDVDLDVKVDEWLKWDKNEQTRLEIEDLCKEKDVAELRKRLLNRMEFGTAGLRARMGAGYSMMNDLTIIQTTQGFVRHMENVCPDLKKKGVVIGYDARYNSRHWAEIVATVLVNRGVRVYLFRQITPTPFVPYGVLQLGCDWGIMITASHNPKWDNGYKVYFSNGAQIISPHDTGISEQILQHLQPEDLSWDISILANNSLVSDPFDQIRESYYKDLMKLCHFESDNKVTSLRFTYTAMHGVGFIPVVDAFKAFSLPPVIPVEEQVEPDPEFPTVKFPNPEEGKSALDLSIQTANANNSTVILANDPDADRLAVAEKRADGKWVCFSGNQLGTLLCWWMVHRHKKKYPHCKGEDVYCLASTVSSKILKTLSLKEGYNFVETLTGFKWMGNKAHDLMMEGKTVLFAFEEAIGFMCGTTVLDKDGVSASVVVAEMASHLAKQGITLHQQLQNIYAKYGHHVSSNSYFLCYDPPTIQKMFERLRNFEGTNKYPTHCGPYRVKNVRDLTTGYDDSEPDMKAKLPANPSCQMITFTFENGCVVTMRTSGTEPKIKYYTELITDPEHGRDYDVTAAELHKVVEQMVSNFFEPEKNGLIGKEP